MSTARFRIVERTVPGLTVYKRQLERGFLASVGRRISQHWKRCDIHLSVIARNRTTLLVWKFEVEYLGVHQS